MHVVAATDKFRGTASAFDACEAMGVGARGAGWTCRSLPLADGGEGTLEALGGPNRVSTVSGPLGADVDAAWRLEGELAVIEMARASGLALAGGKASNDAVRATTRGTGELISAAIAAGATRIVVGVGGSATTDGGSGALAALAAWLPLSEHAVQIEVACDVTTTFVDAAPVFGPQKGASARDIDALAERLEALVARYRREFDLDVATLPGSGAAGGLAGGLAAIGASLVPGFDLIADAAGLDEALAAADVVLTGEGSFDRTSLDGKVVGGVLRRARAWQLPVLAIVGEALAPAPDGLRVVSLVERFGRERALSATATCISAATFTELEAIGVSSPPPLSR
jgi:glycerate kinase